MKKLISLILFLFSLSAFPLTEGVYTVIIKKQEEKKKHRWTLADWLVTKKTIALQDQWLALHSSETWFEFSLDYGMSTIDEDTSGVKTEVDMDKWGAALYIKFLGLEYNKQSFSRDYKQSDYRLNLLLLGSSIQSTHIRGFYGKRDFSYEGFSSYDQNFWGANLTLYFASFLGVEGQFTKYLEADSETLGYSLDGERSELSAFLEFSLLRIYATQFKERNLFRSGSVLDKRSIEGTVLGAKLFF